MPGGEHWGCLWMEILSTEERARLGGPQAMPVCPIRAMHRAMSEGFVTFFTSVCPRAQPSSQPVAGGVIFSYRLKGAICFCFITCVSGASRPSSNALPS